MKLINQIKEKPKLFLVITIILMVVCIVAGFITGFDSGMNNYVQILDDNDIICIEKDNPNLPGSIILSEGINISEIRGT